MDAMDGHGQTRTREQVPATTNGGHRVFWTRQEWRLRLIWPQEMTRPELKAVVLNAAREFGFRVLGWQSAEGWHLAAHVEHSWVVDPEVLLKRLAPAMLTEGVELRELEIELRGGEWREYKGD